MKKSEISISDVLVVLFRRKLIIIASIIVCLFGALLYNSLKNPIYQSSVLLKKELILDNKGEQDPLMSLIALRSQDELETDMQLAQTRSVLNRTIEELSLNILVSRIIEQDGTVTKINLPISEYQNNFNLGNYPNYFPKINKLFIGLRTKENDFILRQIDNKVTLLDKNKNNVFAGEVKYSETNPNEWILDFNLDGKKLKEIHFKTLDYNDVFEAIADNIFTDKKVKTNIFELGVRSNHPYTTKLIANTLTDKFREIRISQQKDNIKNTYEFINERLNKVAENLEVAEKNLSEYKSKEQIIQIDEQSKKIIEFLSNLENEKLKNDLELSLYKNKIRNFEKEMKSSVIY